MEIKLSKSFCCQYCNNGLHFDSLVCYNNWTAWRFWKIVLSCDFTFLKKKPVFLQNYKWNCHTLEPFSWTWREFSVYLPLLTPSPGSFANAHTQTRARNKWVISQRASGVCVSLSFHSGGSRSPPQGLRVLCPSVYWLEMVLPLSFLWECVSSDNS